MSRRRATGGTAAATAAETPFDPVDQLRSAGGASTQDGHHGPGSYTPLFGHVSASGGERRGVSCLGIDVGATMTRFQLGVAGPDGPAELLKIRYLTGDRPGEFLDQVSEAVDTAALLGLGAPQAVRVGIAGPVYRTSAGSALEITNKPGWLLDDCTAELQARAKCADVEIVNDMSVGMHWLPHGPWPELISPLRAPRRQDDECRRTGRRLKCQVGTGLNIALSSSGGDVQELEYGHQPFPAITPLDRGLMGALTAIHGREVITFEDFLGGRGFGPLVLAHAALASAEPPEELPSDTRALLREAAEAAGAADQADLAAALPVAEFDARIRELASRFTRPGTALPLTDSYARFGLWLLTDFLRTGAWPVFGRILAAYGHRLALFVLSAAQIAMVDEVFLGGKLVFEPAVRRGFLEGCERLVDQFAHGSRLADHLVIHAFDEPDYESFLFRTAAESTARQG